MTTTLEYLYYKSVRKEVKGEDNNSLINGFKMESSLEYQDCQVHTLARDTSGCLKGKEFLYLLTKTTVELLTHTLVPLVVLQVALRTAAPVSTHQVLTAVLAPVVAVTLVHICQGQNAASLITGDGFCTGSPITQAVVKVRSLTDLHMFERSDPTRIHAGSRS